MPSYSTIESDLSYSCISFSKTAWEIRLTPHAAISPPIQPLPVLLPEILVFLKQFLRSANAHVSLLHISIMWRAVASSQRASLASLAREPYVRARALNCVYGKIRMIPETKIF